MLIEYLIVKHFIGSIYCIEIIHKFSSQKDHLKIS
jgi:hypothetical protein